MRKTLKNCFTIFFLWGLLVFCLGCPWATGANLDYSQTEGKTVAPDEFHSSIKNIAYGNGLSYVIKLNYYPQKIKYIEPNGKYIYSRGVSAVGTIYRSENDEIPEKLWEHKVQVTFTYDKKSFVCVVCPEDELNYRNVIFDTENEIWRLAQTCEILNGTDYCIVSEMFTVFEENLLTNRVDYIENGHLDLICDIDGNIAVNSKSTD